MSKRRKKSFIRWVAHNWMDDFILKEHSASGFNGLEVLVNTKWL